MSFAVKQHTEIETLVSITDDEAEFWTSLSPKEKASTNSSSDDILSNDSLNKEMEDHLSALYKEKLDKEANDVAENAEEKQIFEFDQDVMLKKNIPGLSMSFLNRLLHQITRPEASIIDDSIDEEFAEIDPSEITAVSNDYAEQSFESQEKSKEDFSLKNSIRLFFEELNEETEVICGKLDKETLRNRRSRRAKSSVSTMDTEQKLVNRTSF